MSRYVKRCAGCRQVRGMTSFRVLLGGGRSDRCRWCWDQRDTRRKHARERAKLRARREHLKTELERITKRLAVLDYELAPYEQTDDAEAA